MKPRDIISKSYNEKALCEKCGFDDISTTYKPHVSRCHSLKDRDDKESREREGIPYAEHLLRTCKRCGYFWPETVIGYDEALLNRVFGQKEKAS